MKAPIIVLFLFHFLAIEAQVADFPGTSVRPIWGIRYKLDLGGFRDEVIGILKDTQICGKNYGFLIGAPLDFSYTVDMGFIRTEGKKVWVKKDARCSSKEYLLYDFDMLFYSDIFSTIICNHSSSKLLYNRKFVFLFVI